MNCFGNLCDRLKAKCELPELNGMINRMKNRG